MSDFHGFSTRRIQQCVALFSCIVLWPMTSEYGFRLSIIEDNEAEENRCGIFIVRGRCVIYYELFLDM